MSGVFGKTPYHLTSSPRLRSPGLKPVLFQNTEAGRSDFPEPGVGSPRAFIPSSPAPTSPVGLSTAVGMPILLGQWGVSENEIGC